MANGITTAFWSVTVNNYDERDLAIFQNGYPDYCRQIVHTLERGEEGTPHIQAWVKLQRQQRMSFMRKLFPGGHFKPLTSDEYVHNTKLYAQKKDGTTQSASVHTFNDPLHTLESVVKKLAVRFNGEIDNFVSKKTKFTLDGLRRDVERDMVAEDYRYAKVFVSATYKSMWKEFGPEILINVQHTHTHTHSDEIFSHGSSITEDATERDNEEGDEDSSQHSGWTEGEDYEDGEGSEDEGFTEGSDSGSSEEASQ